MNASPSPFQPSQRDQVWKEFHDQYGGAFMADVSGQLDELIVEVDDWLVCFDRHPLPGLRTAQAAIRLRAPFANADGFQMAIFPQHLIERIQKALGMQDVATGDAKFDSMYILQTNDEPRLRKILSGSLIRTLIEDHPRATIEIRPDEGHFVQRFPEGTDELFLQEPGEITTIDQMKSLFWLFAELLHGITRTRPGA